MKKTTFNASLILVLVSSLFLGSCQAIQDCFSKKDKMRNSGSECSSCEEGTCKVHDHTLANDSINSASTKISNQQLTNTKSAFMCNLTSPELQKRKEVVLQSLREKMVEKKELANGFAFKFSGDDVMLDELTEFIKTERKCCNFFTFNLSLIGSQNAAWLEITGGEGVKEFITVELEL